MNIPKNLKYSKSHEWVLEKDGEYVIGITDHAQSELGDIVFINLPLVDSEIAAGEAFGDVESVKAVSDILSPVTGTIVAVNEELADAPEKLNEQPYEAWIVKVRDVTETEELLTAEEYEAFISSEA
ncbi:MAG TPA: glycine cleavage system protein GcvH [Clostridiales bacterium]|nr:glycine cleavage system protein GcvH [Clostridiales bacterium]